MKPLIFEAFALSQSYTETVGGKGDQKKKRKRKTNSGKTWKRARKDGNGLAE